MSKTDETRGQVTSIDGARWNKGHSPREQLGVLLERLPDVVDMVCVVRYSNTTRTSDTYGVFASTMPFHDMLGLLEIAKVLFRDDREVEAS